MTKKKVLILTYYWPPSGGGGVHRNLKYAKYFREFGWEPVIYTADEADYPSIDESLFKDVPEGIEVVKRKIWEPYNVYRKFVGIKKDKKIYSGFISENKKMGLTQRIAVWIRGNFFIPDARKFWIKPSIRHLRKYLKENPVDAIISSGPPHSMHLIGLGIKKHLNLPWVADFRDPWTNIDFYDQLQLSKGADRKHRKLEQSVLKSADQVVTVSWHWADDFRALGAPGIKVITNGFDEDDFKVEAYPDPNEFSIAHIGSLNKDRNPPVLWQALKELCDEVEGFREKLVIRLVGNTDISVRGELDRLSLTDRADFKDYMPHKEVLKMQKESQVLLLLLNNTPNVLGVVPGKLFEYMASGRPLLAIGPKEGDSARIITESKAGAVCGFEELSSMKEAIHGMFKQYQEGKLQVDSEDITRYSRRSVTGQMAEILYKLTGGNKSSQ